MVGRSEHKSLPHVEGRVSPHAVVYNPLFRALQRAWGEEMGGVSITNVNPSPLHQGPPLCVGPRAQAHRGSPVSMVLTWQCRRQGDSEPRKASGCQEGPRGGSSRNTAAVGGAECCWWLPECDCRKTGNAILAESNYLQKLQITQLNTKLI